MLDRFALTVVFSYLDLKESTRILLCLCKKTRNEVYPLHTHNALLSQDMYDFSKSEIANFVENVIIGKLTLVTELTFDRLNPQNLGVLAEIIQNSISDK